MREKLKEFVEATLIIGAKRGKEYTLFPPHSEKELIEQHIDSLTNRLALIIKKEVCELLPSYEEAARQSENVIDFWTRNGYDATAWKNGFVNGMGFLSKDIEDAVDMVSLEAQKCPGQAPPPPPPPPPRLVREDGKKM